MKTPWKTESLRTANILIPEGRRELNAEKVKSLKESISEIGLMTPITVREVGDYAYLVTGHHRYAAVHDTGYEKIEAFVIQCTDEEAELWEIDENLMRSELTAAQISAALKRRKDLWLSSKSGTGCPTLTGRGNASFSSDASEKLGQSKRSINRHINRAEAMGADIERVQGTSLDTGAEIDALVKLNPVKREEVIQAAERGEDVSAQERLRELNNLTKKESIVTTIKSEDTERETPSKPPEIPAPPVIQSLDVEGAIDMIKECKLTFGEVAARQLWVKLAQRLEVERVA